MRALLLCLGLITASPVSDGARLLAAIRASDWPAADAAASALPDPLARKLALYYRLLTPGAARAPELLDFMVQNPDWPSQALLARRLQDALATEPDDAAVLPVCAARPPTLSPALLRCADAIARTGRPDAAAFAREAWVRGLDLRGSDTGAEIAFLRQWGRVLTPEDQWRRFDRLAWTDTGAPGGPASRQAARLDPSDRPLAEARLALRRDDPVAPALVNALHTLAPSDQRRTDPALTLDLARWYRRAGLDRDAAQLWVAQGVAAEQAAAPERRGAFWDERALLGRRLLRLGGAAEAVTVFNAPAQTGEAALDLTFLSGWTALQLGRGEDALAQFSRLGGLSASALTQSRAQYWRGRALAMLGRPPGQAYAAAAAWPTTYYGQLAARALGDDDAAVRARVLAVHDPVWTKPEADAILGREAARAAALLASWGEPRRARPFLIHLDDAGPSPGQRAMLAHLASDLGLPDQAVALARRAGRDGFMLPDVGWPAPVTPPEGLDRALLLALMRQESGFDDAIISPAGARGLMQLMPATASTVARGLAIPVSIPALTEDPAYNMRLGTAYLQSLLQQFGSIPLAVAAYNAGPRRVNDWLTANGDPRTGPVSMIDWIELIPFNETRNYVQRVMENMVIYQARP